MKLSRRNVSLLISRSKAIVRGLALFAMVSLAPAQCPSAQGNAALALQGFPASGNLVQVSLAGRPTALALFLLGLPSAPVSFPWGTLCVATGPSLAASLQVLDAGGVGTLQLPIPNAAWVVGLAFGAQGMVDDSAAPNAQFSISNSLSPTITASVPLFADDFESYALGPFPPSGGWSYYFGTNGRIVTPGASSTKALELEGSNCWSTVIYHAVPMIPGRARLEFDVAIPQVTGQGCGADLAYMGFWSPGCTWGCAYDFVQFTSFAGQAGPGTLLVGGSVTLPLTVQVNHWYHMAIQTDFTNGTFAVAIDGGFFGEFTGTTTIPAGIAFYAGHGSPNPVVMVDNVRVYAQ